MGHTEQEIRANVENAFDKINKFYKSDFINYRGRPTDSGELYNEIVCQLVNQHWDEFDKIKTITRTSSYKTETNSHKGDLPPETSKRTEERIAIEMFRQKTYKLGKMIDYQTPLSNIRNDKAGKIDLLMEGETTLWILELKEPDSKESLLRCILEGYTYYKIADHKKLKKDFGLAPSLEVKSAPLIFKDSLQHKQLYENRPELKRLLQLINQQIFIVSKHAGKYEVEKLEL